MLGTLLRDSFPALRSVTVASDLGFLSISEEAREPPWLHIISIGRPIPGILKMIVLQSRHNRKNNGCKFCVGTSEKVAGYEQLLPELLSGLAELTIRLDACQDPQRCAAYIWSVLPGMRDVLRFQYREDFGDVWIPYTLPVAK